jgi:hypothetical protein
VEQNEISVQECRVYLALKKRQAWVSNRELAKEAGIADRTARAKTLKFVGLGICDVAEVFPGHRYRFSEKAGVRNNAYVRRLESAIEVLGMNS